MNVYKVCVYMCTLIQSAFEQINSQSVFVFYLSKFSICGCYAPQMQTSMLKKLSSFDSIVTIVHENVFSVCLVPIFIVNAS